MQYCVAIWRSCVIQPEDFYKINVYLREMPISLGDPAKVFKKIEEQLGHKQAEAYLEKLNEPYFGSANALKQLGIEIYR